VTRRTNNVLAAVSRAIDEIPGYAERITQIAHTARRLRDGRNGYKETHWGNPGRAGLGSGVVVDPSAGPLIVLGELAEIGYLTDKGDDGPGLYVHEFDEERPPILCYGKDSTGKMGLVIARGHSKYTITPRGIVG
jgi:hypothetical protein